MECRFSHYGSKGEMLFGKVRMHEHVGYQTLHLKLPWMQFSCISFILETHCLLRLDKA